MNQIIYMRHSGKTAKKFIKELLGIKKTWKTVFFEIYLN